MTTASASDVALPVYRPRRRRLSGRTRRWLLLAFAAGLVGLYLFPVYWMYISGFKLSGEIFARPPSFFPREPSLDSFRWIFERENMARYIGNSLLIATSTTALSLCLAMGCAYALSRLRSRWLDAALLFILVSQVLPPALMATPLFVIFRQLDLINTQLAVILAVTTKTLPFAIIILRTTFLQVPRELEDAARVDGCSRLGAFFRVSLPVARTGLLVAGAICFMLAYGEFVYAVSLLSRNALQPATVGLYSFVGAEFADWNNVMAFCAVFVTPVVVMFVLLQRHIVRGLTAGAIK